MEREESACTTTTLSSENDEEHVQDSSNVVVPFVPPPLPPPAPTTTTMTMTMTSQIAKDPLGIGIPLPVLVAVDRDATEEEASEAAAAARFVQLEVDDEEDEDLDHSRASHRGLPDRWCNGGRRSSDGDAKQRAAYELTSAAYTQKTRTGAAPPAAPLRAVSAPGASSTATATATTNRAIQRQVSLPGSYAMRPNGICSRRTKELVTAEQLELEGGSDRHLCTDECLEEDEEQGQQEQGNNLEEEEEEGSSCTTPAASNSRQGLSSTIAMHTSESTSSLRSASDSAGGADNDAVAPAPAQEEYLVEAHLVVEDERKEDKDPEKDYGDIEAGLKTKQQDIIVHAEAKPISQWSQWVSPRRVACGLAIVALIIGGLVAGLLVVQKDSHANGNGAALPETAAQGTSDNANVNVDGPPVLKPGLERVKEAGVLRCGTAGEIAELIKIVPMLESLGYDGIDALVETLDRAIQFDRNLVSIQYSTVQWKAMAISVRFVDSLVLMHGPFHFVLGHIYLCYAVHGHCGGYSWRCQSYH